MSFTTTDVPTLYKVVDVQINRENKLIYVLGESIHSKGRAHHVYILNKPLARELSSRNPSQRGGLIFVLDTDCELLSPGIGQQQQLPLEPSLRLYLPSSLQGKLQLPIRIGSLGTKVEEFCL